MKHKSTTKLTINAFQLRVIIVCLNLAISIALVLASVGQCNDEKDMSDSHLVVHQWAHPSLASRQSLDMTPQSYTTRPPQHPFTLLAEISKSLMHEPEGYTPPSPTAYRG